MLLLAHLPALLAAFFASAVEFAEALTVVLAVGAVRGWRPALSGTFAALLLLALIVLILGPLMTMVPVRLVQLLVGILLLAFGARWLTKAIRRAAGVLPLRDEAQNFARETERLDHAPAATGMDRLAMATAFNITLLEGVEVVFIVLAIGAGEPALLLPAAAGASAALGLIMLAGLLLHRPLTKLPDNVLKFATGVLLVAFGIFWLAEGVFGHLPAGDVLLLALVVLVFAGSLGAVRGLRAS